MKGTPEQRLLILCCRQHLDKNQRLFMEKLLGLGLDYEQFLKTARAQYVLPLVYHHLNHEGFTDKVPPKFLEPAKKNFYSNTLRNIQMFKELEKVLDLLKQAGVPVVLLKGGYLANVVYENPALRPFHDFDILFRKDNFSVIKDVLSAAGYKLPEHLLSEKFYLEHHFHIPMVHPAKRVYLEFHWQLLDEYKQADADIEHFWQDLEPFRIGKSDRCQGLGPVNNLLYLSLHIDKHGYLNRFILDHPDLFSIVLNPASENRLIWFVDILELIRHFGSGIDWDLFFKHARAWGVERSVQATFTIMEKTLGWKEGAAILQRFQSFPINGAQKRLYGVVAAGLSRNRGIRQKIAKWAVHMDERTQFRPVRLLDALEILFPSVDAVRTKFECKNPVSILVYYPLNSFRELFRGFRHIAGFVRQRIKKSERSGPALTREKP